MQNEILYRLLDVDKTKNRKRGNLEKIKRNTVCCFNIYIVVFAFMSRIVEEGIIRNFHILPAIHPGYDMILYLFQKDVFFFHLRNFSSILCSMLSSSSLSNRSFYNFSFIVFLFYVWYSMYRMPNMEHERPRSHWDIHTYNAKIEFKIRYEKEFRSFIESCHYFLIHSPPFPYRRLIDTFTAIFMMEHQRRTLSKENTIELNKSAWFSSFSN